MDLFTQIDQQKFCKSVEDNHVFELFQLIWLKSHL